MQQQPLDLSLAKTAEQIRSRVTIQRDATYYVITSSSRVGWVTIEACTEPVWKDWIHDKVVAICPTWEDMVQALVEWDQDW